MPRMPGAAASPCRGVRRAAGRLVGDPDDAHRSACSERATVVLNATAATKRWPATGGSRRAGGGPGAGWWGPKLAVPAGRPRRRRPAGLRLPRQRPVPLAWGPVDARQVGDSVRDSHDVGSRRDPAGPGPTAPADLLRRLDLEFFLPGDLLVKMDCATMAASLARSVSPIPPRARRPPPVRAVAARLRTVVLRAAGVGLQPPEVGGPPAGVRGAAGAWLSGAWAGRSRPFDDPGSRPGGSYPVRSWPGGPAGTACRIYGGPGRSSPPHPEYWRCRWIARTRATLAEARLPDPTAMAIAPATRVEGQGATLHRWRPAAPGDHGGAQLGPAGRVEAAGSLRQRRGQPAWPKALIRSPAAGRTTRTRLNGRARRALRVAMTWCDLQRRRRGGGPPAKPG
jgi:hypothetical protein